MNQTDRRDSGFSMIELLVALAIIAVLILFLMLGQGLQLGRGEDAKRKSDLARLKVAFEDYYNDHGCYPPPELLQRCGSTDFSPYLAKVLCDPRSKKPYTYIRDPKCRWYGIYTTLIDTNDPVITTLNCSPTCIPGQPYNFVQTNGNVSTSIINTYVQNNPEVINVPSGNVTYACDPNGQCNVYDNPGLKGCPRTFSDPIACQTACADPANRCAR